MLTKKKVLFLAIDALLVVVIGVLFGVSCADHIFSSSGGIVVFIILSIVLFLPSVIYLLKNKLNTTNIVVSTLFVLAEVVTSIVFVARPDFGLRNYAITEGVVTGIFLIALLTVIAFYKIDDEKETK